MEFANNSAELIDSLRSSINEIRKMRVSLEDALERKNTGDKSERALSLLFAVDDARLLRGEIHDLVDTTISVRGKDKLLEQITVIRLDNEADDEFEKSLAATKRIKRT